MKSDPVPSCKLNLDIGSGPMPSVIRDKFYCVVDVANRNDGAIQALFTILLIVLAVLAWRVARQQSFTAVLPVLVIALRRIDEEDEYSRWDINIQNAGLGPALDVEVKWDVDPGRARSELGIDIEFPAIEPDGVRLLFSRTAGIDRIEEGELLGQGGNGRVVRKGLGTATVSYVDVHGREGKLVTKLSAMLLETDPNDPIPIRWLVVQNVSSHPPGKS